MNMYPMFPLIADLPEDEEKKKEETSFQKDQRLRAEEYRKRVEKRQQEELEFAAGQREDAMSRADVERDAIAERRTEIRERQFGEPEVPPVPVANQTGGMRADRRGNIDVAFGKERGQMRTEVGFIDGDRKTLVGSDKRFALNQKQWETILSDPSSNQNAIDVLGSTVDAISKLQTPEARQFTRLYNQIEADRKEIEQNVSLTEREKSAGLEDLRIRQSRLAAGIPELGSISEQLESQLMAQERAEADTARRDAAAKLRDYEAAYDSATRIAEKQEADGVAVSPEQFRDIYASEVAKRQAVADFISGEQPVAEAEADVAIADQPEPVTFSNPTGGLVYGVGQDGNPFVRIEGAGPSGPRMPTRVLNGVAYPAPTTSDQVGLLHKGTQYFAPNSNIISVAKTGPDAPNEAALKVRAQEEKDRVKFQQDTYQGILSKQTSAYETFVNETLPETFATMRVLAQEAQEAFTLTPADILAGRTLDVLGETTDLYDTRTLQAISNPPADPYSEAGRQERERQLNLAMRIREQTAEFMRSEDIANQERSAPYRNSVSAFNPKISEGRDVVTYTTDEGTEVEFEAYTITQPGSAFYGRSLPVIRNSTELMQVSPNLYPNFAYYNPEAGRVLASVAKKGSQRGEYTRGEASTIMSQLVELYPADFFDKPGDFEVVFDAFTQYMGYSGPQR